MYILKEEQKMTDNQITQILTYLLIFMIFVLITLLIVFIYVKVKDSKRKKKEQITTDETSRRKPSTIKCCNKRV